jgi:pyruvate ferredoxin oxidoreductase gamma subunit
MNRPFQLPARDLLGFCNILFVALGGEGANTAAKLLFKLGCGQLDLEGGYDARYGSEKKGTVTEVSIRFGRRGTPVRQTGPTRSPHFLVVFHDDLIAPLELGRGLPVGAVVIVNTTRPPATLRDTFQLHSGRIVTVDASHIAYTSRSRLNMPLLGVLCHELGIPDEGIREAVAAQWPRAAAANVAALTSALAAVTAARFEADGRHELSRPPVLRGPVGWRNMANGGTIDARRFTTQGRDNRIAGRGRIPHFDAALCNSCGLCLTVCSDPGGLIWREGRMLGIDPLFCKGCMRCVELCPETKKGRALLSENGHIHDGR